jgi:DNA-directed RNA polymerase specialized sigma24 family protein
VSHANAPLITRDGWPLRRAAERFGCSPATAKKWADRYRVAGVDATCAERRLGKALARLPSSDRDALLLYTFADLDYQSIQPAVR